MGSKKCLRRVLPTFEFLQAQKINQGVWNSIQVPKHTSLILGINLHSRLVHVNGIEKTVPFIVLVVKGATVEDYYRGFKEPTCIIIIIITEKSCSFQNKTIKTIEKNISRLQLAFYFKCIQNALWIF